MFSVMRMITEGMQIGITWRTMMRRSEAPASRTAAM